MKTPLPNGRCLLVAGLMGPLAAAVRAADGPALFADNCMSCHGPDGKARTPAGRKVHAKDLTVSTLPDADIEKQIREGKKDDHGRVAMPAFKETLSADEIAALIPVVKNLRK